MRSISAAKRFLMFGLWREVRNGGEKRREEKERFRARGGPLELEGGRQAVVGDREALQQQQQTREHVRQQQQVLVRSVHTRCTHTLLTPSVHACSSSFSSPTTCTAHTYSKCA